MRFNCVYLRWRGTAADATPPRRSRLGLAGLSARDKPVEGTRDAVAKEDVEGGARAVARRGGHAWRAILECGLCGEGALGGEQRVLIQQRVQLVRFTGIGLGLGLGIGSGLGLGFGLGLGLELGFGL